VLRDVAPPVAPLLDPMVPHQTTDFSSTKRATAGMTMVKRFQTIHDCTVDVARGLMLLFRATAVTNLSPLAGRSGRALTNRPPTTTAPTAVSSRQGFFQASVSRR
jgi:hypothetical protein